METLLCPIISARRLDISSSACGTSADSSHSATSSCEISSSYSAFSDSSATCALGANRPASNSSAVAYGISSALISSLVETLLCPIISARRLDISSSACGTSAVSSHSATSSCGISSSYSAFSVSSATCALGANRPASNSSAVAYGISSALISSLVETLLCPIISASLSATSAFDSSVAKFSIGFEMTLSCFCIISSELSSVLGQTLSSSSCVRIISESSSAISSSSLKSRIETGADSSTS